ncbi:MAG TPA: DUF2911 domain-containing protein [Gemmatimonadales bacterium]|nr:DUF2911 domain-containing protein [Gemmatimonadales bacterium]
MRRLSATICLGLLVAGTGVLQAQAGLRPAPSGRGTSEVILTVPGPQGQPSGPEMKIRVDWGQPHLRGRTLHTDSLVPYDQPWRTGANASTTLSTDVDLDVGGVTLPKGKYVLFTLPGRAGWTLMVQKDVGQGGEYKTENDVGQVTLRVRQLAQPLESLTMWLIPSTAPGQARGELRLAWGTTEVATDWTVR